MEWFTDLPRRQQWFVVIGGTILVLYVLYMALWAPLGDKVDKLSMRNQGAVANLAWLRESAEEVKQLRGAGGGSRRESQMSLSQMVDTSVARQGIRMSRFQPSGTTEAQVWLDKVEFNRLVAWLDQMENGYGVTIKNIAINAGNSEGIVNARVRFSKG